MDHKLSINSMGALSEYMIFFEYMIMNLQQFQGYFLLMFSFCVFVLCFFFGFRFLSSLSVFFAKTPFIQWLLFNSALKARKNIQVHFKACICMFQGKEPAKSQFEENNTGNKLEKLSKDQFTKFVFDLLKLMVSYLLL